MTGPYRHDPAHIRALAVTAVQMLETDLTLNVIDAAAAVGVCASSVYTAWRRAHPDRPPRGHGVTPQMHKAAALPFATLCDVMLRHVPARGEASAREIFEAVLQDKEAGERRLWRALRRLLDTKKIERVGDRFTAESAYRRKDTTMSKKLDREALKRTALAATDEDEWQWQEDGDAIEDKHGQIVLYVDEDEDSDGPVVIASEAVKAHIVAASPPVVLALIERIEELEAALAAVLGSASPHPVEHPAMAAAWEAARAVLAKGTVIR